MGPRVQVTRPMEGHVDPGSGLTLSARHFSPQSLEAKTRKSQSVAPLTRETLAHPKTQLSWEASFFTF